MTVTSRGRFYGSWVALFSVLSMRGGMKTLGSG